MAEGTRKDPLEYKREYNEFLYKLRRFLASKDIPMRKLPLFGGEEIDLYLLYKTVTDLGGWLKVTEERKWHQVAKSFNIPPSCLNSAFALRQLYVRYLERYEKLYFLGEEGDDQPFPRLNLYNYGSASSHTSHPHRDPPKNFERLVLSLQSGLPNEVDFAVNICMLLSNVNNSVFNLAKAPAVVDMMLAHVGVFLEDLYGTSELYKEWYKQSGKDFLKFWKRIMNSDEIKELLPKDDDGDVSDSTQFCAEEIFNIDIPAAHADFELQRVLQVSTILHNFSFDKMDATVLSSHPVCMRFLLFCLHSNIGSLKKLATDTMTNLADKTVLEPLESLNSQLFFFMIDHYVRDSDRHNRICGMNILKKICVVEDNQDSVCKALEVSVYESLVKVLILEDVQLLVTSLETLYQLTLLGQVPCDHVVTIERSIEIFVSLLSVCVEACGADMLSKVKVVDNYHGLLSGVVGAKHTPAKVMVHSVEQGPRVETEAELITQHWLRISYEVDPANTILQRDLYADYLTSCGKLGRGGILNSSSFYRVLKFMYPDLQAVKLNTGQQQLYGLVGIRKVVPEQLSNMNHAHRQSLCRTPTSSLHVTPPRPASPPVGVETNFAKIAHVTRTTTPPLQRDPLTRCDGQTLTNPPGVPMGVQSSTLPGQRHDAIPRVPPTTGAVQPVVLVSTPLQSQNAIRPSLQTNATPLPHIITRSDPVTTSQFSGNVTNVPRMSIDSTNNLGNNSAVITDPHPIPSSSTALVQRHNISTVTLPGKNTNNAPAESLSARKPDGVPDISGAPNGTWIVTTSASTMVKSTLPVRSEHAVVCSVPSQPRTTQVIIVSTQETQSDVSSIMVNGGEERPALKKPAVVASLVVAVPTVNGSQTNGGSDVLFVAREEQTPKMVHKAHEVTISVIENPSNLPTQTTTTTVDPSKPVLPAVLVPSSSRKRTLSLASDGPSENSKFDSTLNLNGPFVASALLRNVAKRQRHSDGGTEPLVNGVGSDDGEQKDWDEVAQPRQKETGTTAPKPPVTLNGVRRDLVFQQAESPASNPHVKTNPTQPDSITTNSLGKPPSAPPPSVISNSGTVNPVPGTVLPSSGAVVETRGQSTVNPVPGTVLPSSGAVVATHGQSTVNPVPGTVLPSSGAVVATHGQSTVNPVPGTVLPSSGAVVATHGQSTVNPVPGTVLPSSGAVIATHGQSTGGQGVVSSSTESMTWDDSRGSEVRGEQAGSASGPYQCKWSGCDCSFVNSKLLYNHAVSAHAPTDQLFTSCQWEGCSHVRRSRASLLFHLRQRHLNIAPPPQVKDPNSLPKPQQPPTVGPIPPNQPSAPNLPGRPVYPPHPSVNPLLMSLKEQLLQTEQESPLTKSVRLTSALILRNIARCSSSGRRKLKRYESSFAEIMCSRVESNSVMAACLHEMTKRRPDEEADTKR